MEPIAAVRGTRDFYPEDMRVRSWLYETIRHVSEAFGYEEYDGPSLEALELYAAKSGEELVTEQSFVFPDRSGKEVALRPELTPSLARMVAQRQRDLVYPLRWWSFGPMWRYERPGKGRTREFYQWNIDLIGAESPQADAELVAVAATFLQQVGLAPSEVRILVNDRRLVEDELERRGIPPAQYIDVFHLIDRRDKMRPQEWAAHAQDLGIGSQHLDGVRATLEDADLWQRSAELRQVFAAVEAYGVQEYVRFASHVVRGLDYYTGMVFEAWDEGGEFRAILGGGRYDNLVAGVGGDPIGGVGFAMGDVVMGLVLEKFGHLPAEAQRGDAPVLVTLFDEASVLSSLRLATELRRAGLRVACFPQVDRLGVQLRYADRIGVRVAVILGPDELSRGIVTVRDLRASTQHTVERENAARLIRALLDAQSQVA